MPNLGFQDEAAFVKELLLCTKELLTSSGLLLNSLFGRLGVQGPHAPRSHRAGEPAAGVHAVVPHLPHGRLCPRLLPGAADTGGQDAQRQGIPPSLQLHSARYKGQVDLSKAMRLI